MQNTTDTANTDLRLGRDVILYKHGAGIDPDPIPTMVDMVGPNTFAVGDCDEPFDSETRVSRSRGRGTWHYKVATMSELSDMLRQGGTQPGDASNTVEARVALSHNTDGVQVEISNRATGDEMVTLNITADELVSLLAGKNIHTNVTTRP